MDHILQRCKLSYGKMKGPVLGSIARMRMKHLAYRWLALITFLGTTTWRPLLQLQDGAVPCGDGYLHRHPSAMPGRQSTATESRQPGDDSAPPSPGRGGEGEPLSAVQQLCAGLATSYLSAPEWVASGHSASLAL